MFALKLDITKTYVKQLKLKERKRETIEIENTKYAHRLVKWKKMEMNNRKKKTKQLNNSRYQLFTSKIRRNHLNVNSDKNKNDEEFKYKNYTDTLKTFEMLSILISKIILKIKSNYIFDL